MDKVSFSRRSLLKTAVRQIELKVTEELHPPLDAGVSEDFGVKSKFRVCHIKMLHPSDTIWGAVVSVNNLKARLYIFKLLQPIAVPHVNVIPTVIFL